MKPPAVKTKLTAQDIADLDRIEDEIEHDQKSFFRFAKNVKEIRDRKLYERDYKTFEAYCELRWGWTRQWISQQLKSYDAIGDMPKKMSSMVDNERKARALSKVEPDKREKVLERVAAKAKPVTAKLITESAKELSKEKDAEILDGSGYPVPERLMALWNRASEPETFLKHLADVRGPMRRIMDERNDLLYAECDMGEIMMSLDKAYAQIKRAVPFAVCPTCQGLHPEKCRACKGRGLISRFSWDHGVPQEMKDIRKKSRE